MTGECPSPFEIEKFIQAGAPFGEQSELFFHIENCPRCMAYLASLAGEPIEIQATDCELLSDSVDRDDSDERVGPWGKNQFGDNQVVRLISRGGMGEVYECKDRVLNRRVALKVFNINKLSTETLARIEREAAIQSRLNHPDIVTIHEFRKNGNRPYILMELVDGRPLSQLLERKPISPRKAATIVARLARAIDYAHKTGVLHRDLKPSNLLISGEISENGSGSRVHAGAGEGWSLKVIDFGLSKWLEEDEAQCLTLSKNIVGTPAYIAPELTITGAKQVGPTADIHALGVILYECLIGRPPYVAENPLQTLDLIRNREPVAPAAILPDLPADLNTICLKCLEKEPAKRYPSALELAEDLERYLGGFPILAMPIGPLARSLRWCRRNRQLAAALITLSALLVSLVVGSIYFGYEQARLRIAVEKRDLQAISVTNIARFMTGLFDQIQSDGQGQPISIVQFLELAEKDLMNDRVDGVLGKTTFLMCVAMAYDRVGEHSRADKILESAEETLITEIPRESMGASMVKGYLFRAYLQKNQPDRAIEILKDALTNTGDERFLLSDWGLKSLEQLADTSLAMNRPDEAIPLLEKAWRLNLARQGKDRVNENLLRQPLVKLYEAAGRSQEAVALGTLEEN